MDQTFFPLFHVTEADKQSETQTVKAPVQNKIILHNKKYLNRTKKKRKVPEQNCSVCY